MKNLKLSVAAVFFASATLLHAQQSEPKTKEKKIDAVDIKASAKKGATQNIISLQRKSVEVIERVGSVQLEKQGIGNVSAAVAKASGTQKQEGSGQIIVRGLGDRYNTTTLNGLPVPSDDPENKNINLEIFKTSIVEYISLDKVYNPSLSGDFGGANINIVSKEQTGKPYFKVGIGSNLNLQTFDKGNFKLQDGGPGFFGFKETTFRKGNPTQLYPFTSKWNFKNADNPFASDLNIEGGAKFGKFSIFAYVGFENNYVYSKGREGYFDKTGEAIKDLNVDRYTYDTNTTALANVLYKINAKNKIGFTTNYIHSSEQDARFFYGYMRELGSNVIINRGDNKITSSYINQLYGNHEISDSWSAIWGLGYNYLNSKRPDRLQNTIDAQTNQLITGSVINNSRYFDNLNDNSFNGFFKVAKQLDQLKIQFGYNGSYKNRNFENTTIGLNFNVQTTVDPNNIDGFINSGNNPIISYSTLRPDNQRWKPFFYNFKQNIQSGFANFDYQVNDHLVMQLGGRFDYINNQSDWDDSIAGLGSKDKSYQKFLPAFNLKYSPNEKQNLRFSASKTYTLPQAKELVPIAYYDVTTNVYGNPYLNPSDNYNADLKWEIFPKNGEVFSITAFGKYIQNPIARTTYSTAASSDMMYFNIANNGRILGLETEWRKDLYSIGKNKIYTFLNATYMNSEQNLKSEQELAAENNGTVIAFSGKTKEKIQGVADFLANVNLGYQTEFVKDKTMDFVMTYSYVGQSLFSLGTGGIGNFYEKPQHLLDANLKFNFNQIGIGLQAKNLLNTENKIEESLASGNYTHKAYTKGRQIGIQLSYKF